MNKFIFKYIIQPFAGRWFKGFILLLFWTIAFSALPAISGWFLASCSLAFITANAIFAYIIPSSIIRFLTLLRTATRYFERLENHKTTIEAHRNLQLKIFRFVAKLPYYKKQANNNATLLENSTYGIDLILNYILLWLLPFTTLAISVVVYYLFLGLYSNAIAIEFIITSSVLLFLLPQFILMNNRKLHNQITLQKDENNQIFIESFRGRIEIEKYNLGEKAINQYKQKMQQLEKLESKLQTNSFSLQLIVGLGLCGIAIFIFWRSEAYEISAPMAIGIFFGIMAQAELSEMLYSGKAEKSSVKNQIKYINSIIKVGNNTIASNKPYSALESIYLKDICANIPKTSIFTKSVTIEIKKGDWIALYGKTGKGKTTLLNSIFFPEYRYSGKISWNNETEIDELPVPECIYITQKAYLLTGSLHENFEGYTDKEIEHVLNTVDMLSWYSLLPNGLSTWLGESGETLSGGQRKKILLAQALLKKPQLLVIDEPTAGISSENAIAIFRNIKQQYPDMTILMATHLKDFEMMVEKVIRL